MQFLEKIKKSIFSLIILILLIISFFVFKFALQKEKIYSPKTSNDQIFVDKQGLISINFGAYGVPETFLINNDNKVLKKYIGPLNDEDVYEIKKITKN